MTSPGHSGLGDLGCAQVPALFLHLFVCFWPCGLWDPSSLTRESCPGHWRENPNHGNTREFPGASTVDKHPREIWGR